jgi:hypothetical protein
MNTLGIKKHSSKGLGSKHSSNMNSLGLKGILSNTKILMPRKEPLIITGIMNKSMKR